MELMFKELLSFARHVDKFCFCVLFYFYYRVFLFVCLFVCFFFKTVVLHLSGISEKAKLIG